jgi:hypothetical protein
VIDGIPSFSVINEWSAFGGADHGWQDIGLEGLARKLSRTVFGIAYMCRNRSVFDLKSIQPGRSGLSDGDGDQCNHFITAGISDAKPGETELLVQADKLVQ